MSTAPPAGGSQKQPQFSSGNLSAVGNCTEKEQEQACKDLNKNCKPLTSEKAEEEFGMLKRHQKAIQRVCKKQGVTATFRKTNQDCLPWIKEVGKGVYAKPHRILDKTIGRGRLQKLNWGEQRIAELEEKGVFGLVGHWEGKKLVGVKTINGRFKKLENIGSAADIPPNVVTGDYDMHELIKDGEQVASGGAAERNFISEANESMGQKMIQHGPQATYREFVEAHPKEKLVKKLLRPDPPVLVIDKDGQMYALKDNTDIANFYRCKGTPPPKDWQGTLKNAIKQKGGA